MGTRRRHRTGGTVRALELRILDPRTLLALAVGPLREELYYGGPGSPLRLVERRRPDRPDGWVRVRPHLSGICGSDLKWLHLTRGFSTTASAIFGLPPAVVPGHEVVGTVVGGDGALVGERVVVEPTLACAERGTAPCPRCTEGRDQLCDHLGIGGALPAGNGIGYHARYGGGWSEELVAPAARVNVVPDDLPDRVAVLAEPMAVAVHAVAANRPAERALVVGPGAIGLCVVHALRALAPDAEVTVAAVDHANDDRALAAGATRLLHGTRRGLVEAAGGALGTPVLGNRLSGPVLAAGFDVVFDTVASEQTLDDAARVTRPGGTVVVVGTAGRQRVDWTLVWARELAYRGTFAYGEAPSAAGAGASRRRDIAVALDVLSDARPDLVTHVFPLDRPVEALTTAAAGPAAGAVRVAFSPTDRRSRNGEDGAFGR